VIHRDLKPENILLHEGQPLVADFGIALAVRNAGGNRITQTGLSLGTPQYMSPEQATSDRTIDARTDIYSLGAVTYEMLTGEAPHTGNTAQAIIARLLTEHPRPIRTQRPHVSEQVEAAVERALEKLPADRWATAREFSEALSGARVVVRAQHGTTSAMASAAATAAPAATADYTIVVPRRLVSREVLAWGLALTAVAALALTLVSRPAPPPTSGIVTTFELMLPDSLRAQAIGSGAMLALSPDGSSIVFAGSRPGGMPSLYLRRMDDPEVVQLRGTDSARGPIFSNDGSEIAFSPIAPPAAGRGRGQFANPLNRLSIRGGTARTLVDSGAGAAQSSWGDNDQIVFTNGRGLYAAKAAGGAPVLIALLDTARNHRRYGFPHLLPGGKAAVITIWLGANFLDSATIGVVTIPEGKVIELGIRGTYPRYSPTGHLLYATTDAQIMAVPFSARSLSVTGAPVVIVEGVNVGGGGAATYAISRTGTLAYGVGDAASRKLSLLLVDRDGNETPLAFRPGPYGWPRISPDGKQVALAIGAYTGAGGGVRSPDIWRLDLLNKQLARVTTDSQSTLAAWHPDGQKIANGSISFQGDSVTWVRNLYNLRRREILNRGVQRVTAFTYGPAGGYAAMTMWPDSTNGDIWIAHMDSLSAPRPLLTEPYGEGTPRVSPDGRVLAYTINRSGRSEVFVRPLGGDGPERQVSLDGGNQPAWGPDSRELFYRASGFMMSATVTGAGRELAVQPQRDSLFRDIYSTPIGGGGSAQYDIMPGGKQLIMMRNLNTAPSSMQIMVIVNWPALLRERR
jgi:serine/threonine-protein kinase